MVFSWFKPIRLHLPPLKMKMDAILEDYRSRDFTNHEIFSLLEKPHDIKLSLRSLERTLPTIISDRKKSKTDEAEVASFIHQQLRTSGQQHGCTANDQWLINIP